MTLMGWGLALGLTCALAGVARAADLDRLPPPPIVKPLPVVVAPAVVLAPVVIPVPLSLLPFFGPPPSPLPSYTLFSDPVGYPPEAHYHGRTRTPGAAEAEHYGYGGYVPRPRPLGFYGPDNRD